jgi:hypothetical protein
MAIEIVDFPIKNGGSFHSYVSLPEGMSHPYPSLSFWMKLLTLAWLNWLSAQVLRMWADAAAPWVAGHFNGFSKKNGEFKEILMGFNGM